MTHWFTADQHFWHGNILKFEHGQDHHARPFGDLEEMHEALVVNHNSVVRPGDTVVHVGDFSFGSKEMSMGVFRELNGSHVIVQGSHDKWLGKLPRGAGAVRYAGQIWTGMVEEQQVVACHYAMRVWPGSHYGSWLVYAHSHGRLPPLGKSHDVGVDNNGYFPVSFGQLREIMEGRRQHGLGKRDGG